jgi:hypothetical protein
MAEFAPALLVFILLLFPLINLIGYGCAVATCQLIGRQTAQAAGTGSTFTLALAAVQTDANSLLNSAWGKFAKITAVGGYTGCGMDLYVTATPISGGSPVRYGPNTPYTGTVDNTNFIYEYTVSEHYLISPFVPLGSFPFFGGIPIIGQASAFNMDTSSAAEFPDGLTQ